MPITRAVAAALALAAPVVLATGCKPSAQKVAVGPFNLDRYDATGPAGEKIDCYVFGADSNKPSRLCGEAQAIPGFGGLLFKAAAAAPDSKFVSTFGTPLDPGLYLVRQQGIAVDVWPVGKPAMTEWIGGGKAMLAVETSPDHHTHVRLLDPVARTERNFDAGPMKAESWILVRADNDAALLLLQKLGGAEMIAIPNAVTNPDVLVGDASDDKSAGNRKLWKRGDLDRMNGGVFKPNATITSAFAWNGTEWTFEGAPLGPFTPAPTK